MDIQTDRLDYFMKWWDIVEPKMAVTGHVREVVRSDGYGVFVANTLRRIGYDVKIYRDAWFPFNYIEIKKAVR